MRVVARVNGQRLGLTNKVKVRDRCKLGLGFDLGKEFWVGVRTTVRVKVKVRTGVRVRIRAGVRNRVRVRVRVRFRVRLTRSYSFEMVLVIRTKLR